MGFEQGLNIFGAILTALQGHDAGNAASESNLSRLRAVLGDDTTTGSNIWRASGSQAIKADILGENGDQAIMDLLSSSDKRIGDLDRLGAIGVRELRETGRIGREGIEDLGRFTQEGLGNLRQTRLRDLDHEGRIQANQDARNIFEYGAESDRLLADYGGLQSDIMGGLRSLRDDVVGGYGRRGQMAQMMLRGLGGQERRDIDQAFDRRSSAETANLAARGLGGTSLGSTLRTGIDRERTDAQGRLGERLRRERLGTFLGTSGDTLSAKERRNRSRLSG